MIQRRLWVLVLALFAPLAPAVYAQRPDENVTIQISTLAFRCNEPKEVSCIVYAEEDKERCGQCREWENRLIIRSMTVAPIDASQYGRQERNAKEFLKEILTTQYEMSPKHVDRLMPPSIRDLYDHPGRWGWELIGKEIPGAIMFDRNRVALILGNDEILTHEERRPRTIKTVVLAIATKVRHLVGIGKRNLLHPSATHGGIGKSAEEDFFKDPKSPPKVAIPRPEPAKSDIPVAWNGWFERRRDSPIFKPLRRLDPGQKYRFVAHFAGRNYTNLYGVPAVEDSLSRMTNLARTTEKNSERMTAVILTDGGLLAARNLVEFDFNIAALRRWDQSPDWPEGDVMEHLAEHKTGPFVFGELTVEVTTMDREGLFTIGVSLWDADGWPVDELAVPICVARNEESAKKVCPERAIMGRGFGSYDLERMNLKSAPAGAIHFVDLGRAGVQAAFRRNDGECRGDTYVWTIHKKQEDLVALLSSIADDFANTTDVVKRAGFGRDMLDALFAGDEPSNAIAKAAQYAFIEFARDHMHVPPANGKEAPLLFVRMTPRQREDDPPPMVRVLPFGIAKVDDWPDSYLGFFFRIESPLSRQIADDRSECASRWKLVVPPLEADTLRHYREEHVDRNLHLWARKGGGGEILDDMDRVRDYLKKDVRDPEPTTLVVLSHYGIPKPNAPARIRFLREEFGSNEIRRVYTSPAIAFLSGCGTAEIGSEDFAHQLNMHGVDAVVATTTSVPAEMGVQFLECVEDGLPFERNRDTAPSLSELLFDSVQCLRDRIPDDVSRSEQVPHHAAALAFTLLGNGRLPVCGPEAPR